MGVRSRGRWSGASAVVGALLGGLLGVSLVVPLPAAAAAVVTRDVRYAVHGGIPLSLDVYEPAGHGPFPAVVVIPGGRWVNIDKTKHADVPEYLAAHGIAAFAIEYRSALVSPYPAAVQDVSAAVRWVRDHAADYEVDPQHIGAVGVSAGGHLAALIGARGTGPTGRGARVDLVVSFSGPMDLRPLVDADDPELREAVRDFLGCASGPCPDASEASPITHVDPTDPPMVLINGNDEIIPVSQAQGMARALQDAGVQNKVWIVQGGHGAGYGGGDKVLDLIIPYVEAWVEGRRAPTPAEGVGATGSTGKGQGEEEPAGNSGAASSGKGSGGEPTPVTQPPDAKSSETSGQSAKPAETVDAFAIAAAMIALLLVVVLLVVVVRLRRRVAGLTAGNASQPSGVEEA